MFCPNCGNQNEDTSKFCKICGASFAGLFAEHTDAPEEGGDVNPGRETGFPQDTENPSVADDLARTQEFDGMQSRISREESEQIRREMEEYGPTHFRREPDPDDDEDDEDYDFQSYDEEEEEYIRNTGNRNRQKKNNARLLIILGIVVIALVVFLVMILLVKGNPGFFNRPQETETVSEEPLELPEETQTPTPESEARPAVISNRVIALDTKQQLPGVTITLASSDGQEYTAMTDEKGTFSVSVPAGTYVLKAHLEGYKEYVWSGSVVVESGDDLKMSDWIYLDPVEPTEAPQEEPAALSGTVINIRTQKWLPYAEITLVATDGKKYTATTDTDGTFEIHVPAGHYRLQAFLEEYLVYSWAETIVLEPGEDKVLDDMIRMEEANPPTETPTPEPTETETPTPTPTATPTPEKTRSGYVIPDSNSRYLTESDLAGMSKSELQLARNEIFARHGRRFESASLQEYFDSCTWYNGTIDPANFDGSVLNDYEDKNAQLLREYENSLG